MSGFQLQHQYLVAYIHSEGLGRSFISTKGPMTGVQAVLDLDRRIEEMTHHQRVQVFSYQLVGTQV